MRTPESASTEEGLEQHNGKARAFLWEALKPSGESSGLVTRMAEEEDLDDDCECEECDEEE